MILNANEMILNANEKFFNANEKFFNAKAQTAVTLVGGVGGAFPMGNLLQSTE
jgi:hypothetical protein